MAILKFHLYVPYTKGSFLMSYLNILSWILFIVFLIGALVNTFATEKIKNEYKKWGYPKNFQYLTALLELIVACLILDESLRFWGLLLAILVMLVAVVTLLLNKEKIQTIPAIIVIVLALNALFLNFN